MCRQRHSWSRQSGGAVLRTGPPRSACPGTGGAEYASIGRPWKMPRPGRGEPVGQKPSVSVRRYSTRDGRTAIKYMPCHLLTGNCDSACGYAAFGTACEPYRPGMYASTAKLIPVSALGSLLTRCSIIKGRSVLDLPTPINLAPSHAPCLLSGAPA